jgi:hypothetical protein
MALLDLENGAEAVNWHVEVTETHPPKVKLTALMRSPSDPPKARFVGEHDAQAATLSGSNPPGLLHSIWKAVFLKAS